MWHLLVCKWPGQGSVLNRDTAECVCSACTTLSLTAPVLAQRPSHHPPQPSQYCCCACSERRGTGKVKLQEQHKLESCSFQGPYLPPVSIASSIFVPCCWYLSLPLPASGPSLCPTLLVLNQQLKSGARSGCSLISPLADRVQHLSQSSVLRQHPAQGLHPTAGACRA